MTSNVLVLALGCLGVVAIIGSLLPTKLRTSLSRFLVADDLARAVEKAQSIGEVQSVAVGPDGHLRISVQDEGRLRLVTVHRSSGFVVSARYIPSDSFPNPARYAWDLNHCKLPEDTRFDLVETQRRLTETFEEVLSERGFLQSEDGMTDFFFRFRVENDGVVQSGEQILINEILEKEIDLEDSTEIAKFLKESSIERACLTVEFLDSLTGEVVWRGVAQADLEIHVIDAGRNQRRRNAIIAILGQYPPKPHHEV